jgi:hypothetical protein
MKINGRSILYIGLSVFSLTAFARPSDCASLANGDENRLQQCSRINAAAVHGCRGEKERAIRRATNSALRAENRDSRQSLQLKQEAAEVGQVQDGRISVDQQTDYYQRAFSQQQASAEGTKSEIEKIKREMDEECRHDLQRAQTADAVSAIDRIMREGDKELDEFAANQDKKRATAGGNYEAAGVTDYHSSSDTADAAETAR